MFVFKINVYKFLSGYVFISLWYIHKSGISGSNGNPMLNFSTNCQTVFQNGSAIFYYQQYNVLTVFLYISRKLVILDKMLWIQ